MKKVIEILKIVWDELTRPMTHDEIVEQEAIDEGRATW